MSRKDLPPWLVPVLIVGGCGLAGMFLLLGVIVVLLLYRDGSGTNAETQVAVSTDTPESSAPSPSASDELAAQALRLRRQDDSQAGLDALRQPEFGESPVPAPAFPPGGPPPGFGDGFGPFGGLPAPGADVTQQAALDTGAAQPPQAQSPPVSLADLVERVQPAMVKITVDLKRGGSVQGSGFLFGDRSTVVTNYHVIEGAAAIRVRFKDSNDMGVLGVAGYDKGNDLAVVKIPHDARRASPLGMSPSLPRVGEKAFAFGSPQGFSFTTSEGIVSAVRSGSEIRKILRELSGADEYTQLGLSITNTWLQITTPISTGNSGGPLLDDQGRLIGVNTLTLRSGQNLNLAIAAGHVRDLVDQSKQRPMIAVTDLPAPRRSPSASPAPRGAAGAETEIRIQIASPSGKVFDSKAWEINMAEVRALIDVNAETAVLTYDSGAVYGVATHLGGVLDGFSIALYENKELMRMASYEDGSRHGKLATWNELGQVLYFGEFFKGKNDGFCGIIGDDGVDLLMEYDKGTLVWVHRIVGNKIAQSFDSREAAAADVETLAALDRYDEREKEVMAAEVEYRRDLRDYAQEERRARAAYLGAQKRARMQARINQRSAAQDAVTHALRRTSGY